MTTNLLLPRRFLLLLQCSLYIPLFFVPLVVANSRGGPDDINDNDDGSANLPGSPNIVALDDPQGDIQCPGSKFMCVTGIVNGSSITYELQSTGVQPFGWMAIGFGTQMSNTPMVIMWANADGSITLSQRQALAQVIPTVVVDPPKAAVAVPQLSSITATQPKLVFTIPGTASVTNLIWAFGTTKPAQPASAILLQHIGSGIFTLDLTKTLPGGANGTARGFNGTTSALSILKPRSSTIPFLPYQKLIIAHATFVCFGFLIFLPSSVLLARLSRTYNNKWFKWHWTLQFALAGPAIIIGCILGFLVKGEHESHTPHKAIGGVLLGLYLEQCALGAFIHFVKIRFRKFSRPPQNYIHAILGLTILGLSFYEARLGFTQEWPNSTGRSPVSNAVDIIWAILLAIVAVAYIGGLAYYLPRQLRQEKKSRKHPDLPSSIRGNTMLAEDEEEAHDLNNFNHGTQV